MRITTMSIATVSGLVILLAALPGTVRADNFADAVTSFSPAVSGGQPTAPHLNPDQALGAPDYSGVNSCGAPETCTFVSLGSGGTITLRFIDNALTGSDSNAPDLWIYEIGPDVEDTFVEISSDNVTWHAVGKVFGSTSTVDIDAFGHTSASSFQYVRLTDDPNEGASTGTTVGADIDAVEALSSIPIPVEPTTWSAIKSRH